MLPKRFYNEARGYIERVLTYNTISRTCHSVKPRTHAHVKTSSIDWIKHHAMNQSKINNAKNSTACSSGICFAFPSQFCLHLNLHTTHSTGLGCSKFTRRVRERKEKTAASFQFQIDALFVSFAWFLFRMHSKGHGVVRCSGGWVVNPLHASFSFGLVLCTQSIRGKTMCSLLLSLRFKWIPTMQAYGCAFNVNNVILVVLWVFTRVNSIPI